MTTKERCIGTTRIDDWDRPRRCARNASCTEDGKPYCATHAPSRVADRAAKRDAEWEAKWEAERLTTHKLALYDDLLAACKAARAYMKIWQETSAWDENCVWDYDDEVAFAQLEAVIALAESDLGR